MRSRLPARFQLMGVKGKKTLFSWFTGFIDSILLLFTTAFLWIRRFASLRIQWASSLCRQFPCVSDPERFALTRDSVNPPELKWFSNNNKICTSCTKLGNYLMSSDGLQNEPSDVERKPHGEVERDVPQRTGQIEIAELLHTRLLFGLLWLRRRRRRRRCRRRWRRQRQRNRTDRVVVRMVVEEVVVRVVVWVVVDDHLGVGVDPTQSVLQRVRVEVEW